VTIDLPVVRGLHHVALAVADLDAAIELWTGAFGAEVELRAQVEVQGVDAATLMWRDAGGAPGLPHGTLLELVAPLTSESGIARFLDKRGAGMHHIAYAVDDVAAALAACVDAGLRVIDAEPRPGLHGTPVAFIHPASFGGTLVELVEVPAA
jgi:methylmalonyl-CoA epimerase